EAKGQFERSRRAHEFGWIEQINRDFPVRQNLADLRRDEWTLPIRAEPGVRKGGGLRGVVEERHADLVAQHGFDVLQDWPQLSNETRESQLRAEDHIRICWRTAPEQQIEFVANEPGERSFRGIADQLTKLAF